MHVSTKKGDTGQTSLLRGERVPKDHPSVEAVGILDETNSLLGLARASLKEKRVKRIILQVQKHLFVIGAELSVPGAGGKPPRKTISEKDIRWLERLIEGFEETLDLPPGFVAFGQEKGASQLDVARTSVRNAERMAVKMKSEGMIENPYILKYLNRLSDLIFVLACFEEKGEGGKWSDPTFRKWTMFAGAIILVLVTTIIILLFLLKPAPQVTPITEHMKQMESMHQFPPE